LRDLTTSHVPIAAAATRSPRRSHLVCDPVSCFFVGCPAPATGDGDGDECVASGTGAAVTVVERAVGCGDFD
jgi:hypothetical protein